jgi:hypothetical protein
MEVLCYRRFAMAIEDWPKDVSTVYLGQYDRETANEIAGSLEEAGIFWWYKEPGIISSVWEFGVRLFVDKARKDEAKALAAGISDRRRREIFGPAREGDANPFQAPD